MATEDASRASTHAGPTTPPNELVPWMGCTVVGRTLSVAASAPV